MFYFLNGYRFEYDQEIRSTLQQFGIDEAETVAYLRAHTAEIHLPGEIEAWRNDLVQYGLDQLGRESSDPND